MKRGNFFLNYLARKCLSDAYFRSKKGPLPSLYHGLLSTMQWSWVVVSLLFCQDDLRKILIGYHIVLENRLLCGKANLIYIAFSFCRSGHLLEIGALFRTSVFTLGTTIGEASERAQHFSHPWTCSFDPTPNPDAMRIPASGSPQMSNCFPRLLLKLYI